MAGRIFYLPKARKEQKAEQVEEIAERLKKAKVAVLTDYRVLTVRQLQDLRTRRPACRNHANPCAAARRSAERIQRKIGGGVIMATKITPKDFVEALKEWSILDVVEAVKAIEDEFGIKAAAPVAVAAAAPAAGGEAAPAEEEQTEFTVTLTAVGDSKINVIKAVRELTQLGLKEAKDLVDAAPKPVLENVAKADAEKAVARLKEAGATAEMK